MMVVASFFIGYCSMNVSSTESIRGKMFDVIFSPTRKHVYNGKIGCKTMEEGGKKTILVYFFEISD